MKGMVKRLSIIGIVCLILIGVVGLLTNIYLDGHFSYHIKKLSSIKEGMTKEEIQHILGKGGPISKLPSEVEPNKEADEVWAYVFRLGCESGGYFVLFFKQNKLIEKAAFVDGAPLFTGEGEVKKRRGSIWGNIIFVVITLIGIAPLWICTRIARGPYLLQNGDNALLVFVIIACMVFALCILGFMGLIDLSNGFEILCIMY